jgi:hypothetical protein
VTAVNDTNQSKSTLKSSIASTAESAFITEAKANTPFTQKQQPQHQQQPMSYTDIETRVSLLEAIPELFEKSEYFNWDEKGFRKLWTTNPKKALEAHFQNGSKNFVILDEIHKAKLEGSVQGVVVQASK